MSEEFVAKGINGQLTVKARSVVVARKGALGFMTQGLKGEKEIPIDQITAVQFKKAGMTSGYIQLTISGGVESKGGVFSAGNDENTVMFVKKSQADFEKAKSLIEERRSRPGAAAAPATSNLDEISKLADLKAKGIITDEEFAAKKKQLLGL